MRIANCRIICTFATLCCASLAMAQNLVPLDDEAAQPLLPAGIVTDDVEMFGELVYLWTDADGTNVVHFVGDFELQLGARRLYAREAVIWLTPQSYNDTKYIHLEIVLWRDAKVVEPGGTVTRGPALFVTLNASGNIRTSADRKSQTSSADRPVYKDAVRIREAAAERLAETPESETSMTVIDLGPSITKPSLEVRPEVNWSARDQVVEFLEDRSVITLIGNVLLFREQRGAYEPLELRADAAVVFLAKRDEAAPGAATNVDDRPGRGGPSAAAGERGTPPVDVGEGIGGIGLEGSDRVEGVYLEGDIVLSSGLRTIRASRLYYDFFNDRALILDAVFHTFEPSRGLPVYLRAEMIRQLSATEFSARDAKVTTSEFHTPHYHIGASEVLLVDRTRRDPLNSERSGLPAGSFQMRDTTFNIGGVPLLYWPYVAGDIRESETSIKSVRTGYSDDFGVELQTKWELFNILGLEKPVGFDGTFHLDYFSERGPATGIDLDYETDNSFGLLRSYYIHDTGKDNLGGRFRDEDPDTENRGRFTFRHREYLPDDWQLTFELSYISDKNFLEEYFEQEYDQGKDQETLLYLKKQVDNWAFTAHLQYRILDFVTTTERLPDFSFFLVGQPIGQGATWHSENRAGFVRYRPRERNLFQNIYRGGREDDSGTVARADTRQEIEVPLKVGDVQIVPFGSIRGTAYDDTPEDGGVGRVFGTYGVRASHYAWKVYPDAHSELLDIDGIRHIIKTDVTGFASHTNRDSHELYHFDESVDEIDEVDGVSLGVRQRWQTKRGAPGKQRTVDVLVFDVELGLFNDAESDEFTNGFTSYTRPENSISQNYINASALYRVNDSTDLAAEVNYDINDGEIDVLNLTYAVERTPRLSYLIGYRYIGEQDSNLLGFGLNYQISEKYILALREEFDLERGQTAEFDIGVIRKFPRWYVGTTLSVDEIEDDFGISISAWPEGLPRAALGSRRFTGLATSTGIRPGS